MTAAASPTTVAHQEGDIYNEKKVSTSNEYALQWNAHMKATAALCLCIASMSYMIISVFPYSGFMAIHLVDGLTEETAGPYAGLLASSFMVGRAFTSYAWGKWADLYGRRFVLLLSLTLCAWLNLAFGMAATYGAALATRFMLGFSNGVMTTAKTAATEVAFGNARLEKRGMGLVVGTWGGAFLWAPAVGGFLAEPVKQYPRSVFFQHIRLLSQFPFLLPNLVAMLVCLLAMLAVYLWVPETLAQDKRRRPSRIPRDALEWLCGLKEYVISSCCGCSGRPEEEQQLLQKSSTPSVIAIPDDLESRTYDDSDDLSDLQLRRSESGHMLSTQLHPITPRPSLIQVKPSFSKRLSRMSSVASVEDSTDAPRLIKRSSSVINATIQSLWSRIDTRVHLILYWMFAFVQVTGDEAFPLYCISKEGGLGLSESSIGKILSFSGLLFAICQYFIYALIVNHLGLYGSMIVGTLCLPILAFIPFTSMLGVEEDGSNGLQELSWGAFIYLCTLLSASRILASVYFSSIFIALNRTVPTSHRASMNGLQTLGGSISKGLAPIFAGLLVSFSFSSGLVTPKVGGFFIWTVVGAMGVLNTAAVTCLLKEEPV